MADGVHTPIEAMKVAGHDAPLDAPRREPELDELSARDDTVLSVGQSGDLMVTWTILTTCTVVNIVHVSHAPTVTRKS